MAGLVLFICLKSLSLSQTTCWSEWRRYCFLLCCPPHLQPNCHLHHHHLPNVSHMKRARECLPPLPQDFPILWHPDKLWLTSSMWVRETWRYTACIAFCNYICFTALFLLPSLSPSSKREVDLWLCVHAFLCVSFLAPTQAWASVIPVHHLWAQAIFLTSRQTTLEERLLSSQVHISLYALSIHCNATHHLL